MRKITIAIDGYSSCGKSTVANGLAKKLEYSYIDSGSMYRAVALYCLQQRIILNGKFLEKDVLDSMNHIHLEFKMNRSAMISEMYLNGNNVEKEIRTMEVSNYVSPISAIKGVRQKIVGLQKEFGRGKGIVMDGRDIGTNVFPDAELKIFMTADENIRAQRRWKEMSVNGVSVNISEVKKNLISRDYEDTHREFNPLRKAEDAILLDTSNMKVEEQLNWAVEKAAAIINR